MTHKVIKHSVDSKAIPFELVKEAIDKMSYATPERVMFKMLALTGCRITELDNMVFSQIYPLNEVEVIIYWRKGKNQKGSRKTRLPMYYLRELQAFRETFRCYHDKLFNISSNSFRRLFNTRVRPLLSERWHWLEPFEDMNIHHHRHIYTLKGLRKNFQTHLFYKEYLKWNDASVALEKVSKLMGHSSKHITANHYIENLEPLEVDKFACKSMAEIIKSDHQTRIMDY